MTAWPWDDPADVLMEASYEKNCRSERVISKYGDPGELKCAKGKALDCLLAKQRGNTPRGNLGKKYCGKLVLNVQKRLDACENVT